VRKKKIEIKIDPEELAVQSRVKDIMGPAQHLDGSKPSDEEIDEMTDAGFITEKADGPVQSINQRVDNKPLATAGDNLDSAPEVISPQPITPLKKSELEVINEKLNEQIEDGLAELDLADMGESDVTKTQELFSKNRAESKSYPQTTEAAAQEVVLAAKASVALKSEGLQAKKKHTQAGKRIKRIVRYAFLGLVTMAVVVLAVPSLRAAVLNILGVRSSIIVKTVDDSTTLPLEGVVVGVDGKQAKTDKSGVAKITDVRLGEQAVTINKSGFYPVQQIAIVDIRIADLGEVSLKPSGEPYTYILKDYISGSGVQGAVLKSGDVTTTSEKDGKAIITLKQNSEDPLVVSITAKGYRTEEVTPSLDPNGPVEVWLVPDKKHAYVSKEANRYDVYVVDVDGKNSKLLLEGTGLETSAIAGLMSANNRYFALVSTRDDKRSANGTLLSALTILDVSSEEATVIEHAELISLLGWSGDTLVYTLTSTSAPATAPDSQKIQSYNVANTKRVSLGKASSYLAVTKTANAILAVEASATDVQKDVLQTISYNGEKKEIYSGDILAVGRIGYTKFSVQTPEKVYEYTLGNTALADGSQAGTRLNRYRDSPDAKTSVWLDANAAQSRLFTYSVAANTEKPISLAVAPTNILWWVGNDGVVVQVNSNGQTADYIVSLRDGKAQKIADSTAITSVN
jgi:hypothetical protein